MPDAVNLQEDEEMLVLNFGHPLTRSNVTTLRKLLHIESLEIRQIKTMFDQGRSFVEQVHQLIDSVNLTSEEWQTTPFIVNLPSLNVIAALVLAEMHGRCGYFPAVIRLKPVRNSLPARFEVAEVLNLQAVRDAARNTR